MARPVDEGDLASFGDAAAPRPPVPFDPTNHVMGTGCTRFISAQLQNIPLRRPQQDIGGTRHEVSASLPVD